MVAGLIQAKRNYNPSLVSTREGFLLAYRSEKEDFTRSDLVLAEMDSSRQVLRNQRLKVPGVAPEHSLEDPRLFWFDGDIHIAFSIAHYGLERGWKAVQAYGRLVKRGKSWTLPKIYRPRYGANDWSSKEKNWTFFEAEDALRCVYDMGASGWTVLELDGDRVVQEWRQPPLSWRWGRMSGGTPAVIWDGQLLAMFHSWEKHPGRSRLYHMGFVSFDALAPHAPRMISRAPVLTAKHEWGAPEGEAWAPLCVFPGGIEVYGGRALVAYGKNDHDMAIEPFRIEQLIPARPRASYGGEQRLRLTGDVMIKGQPAWAGTEVAVLASDAANLIARGKAVPL